jgi:glycosyltransferase involved in cell wall biosynthesis
VTPLNPWPHHPGVSVHTLHSRFGPLSPLLSQQTGRPWLKAGKIRRILTTKKFDVIHYHNISLFGPKIFAVRPNYADYLQLYTAHEHWLICPMHTLWKSNDHLCDHRECLRCSLRYHRPPQWWRYTNLLQRLTDTVDLFISPSRFSIDLHQQSGFGKPFVHLPSFTPAPDPQASASEQKVSPHPYFLYVGRLEKIKGLQNVIPAFRRRPQASLLIAGIGSYEPELRRLARGLDNVKFLGWVEPGRLQALYRNAIALIVSSLCYEVSPLVLFEAFANRTPVIVNALGALPEIVQECQGGLTYSNQEELASAMEQLQSNQNLRNQLGDRGHARWSERWIEGAHLDMYFAHLAEAAQRKYGSIPWQDASNTTSP